MNKILIVSFYWPPSGKASHHWPLKMANRLLEEGWLPSILTVKEDTFTDPDPDLEDAVDPRINVIRTKFWDPFAVYKKFLGKSENSSLVASEALSLTDKSIKQRISIWIRMNLFIPDARVGWVIPGFREAKKILKNEKFDAILSNGPPHSTHLLAKKISKKYTIPLVSVFIDPWVDIAYYKNQKRSLFTTWIDNRFEKSVMQSSSKLIFVTNTMNKYFKNKYKSIDDKSYLLYWGYNEENFSDVNKNKKNDELVILHAGNIFDYQNPVLFWEEVKREIENGMRIKIRFVGTVSPQVKKSISEFKLDDITEYKGFLPYKNVIEEIVNSDILLVCATEPRHVPGKLFEYMRSGNRIVAFGEDNQEVREILNRTNAGELFSYDDDLKGVLRGGNRETNMEEVKKFDRNNIALRLAEILKEL